MDEAVSKFYIPDKYPKDLLLKYKLTGRLSGWEVGLCKLVNNKPVEISNKGGYERASLNIKFYMTGQNLEILTNLEEICFKTATGTWDKYDQFALYNPKGEMFLFAKLEEKVISCGDTISFRKGDLGMKL